MVVVAWKSGISGVEGVSHPMPTEEAQAYLDKKSYDAPDHITWAIEAVPVFPAFYVKSPHQDRLMMIGSSQKMEIYSRSTEQGLHILSFRRVEEEDTILGKIGIYAYSNDTRLPALSELFQGKRWCHILELGRLLKRKPYMVDFGAQDNQYLTSVNNSRINIPYARLAQIAII